MDVNLINVITLAYLGDSIYEVYVREHLIKNGIAKVEELQKEAVKYVSAKSQCKILSYLIVPKMNILLILVNMTIIRYLSLNLMESLKFSKNINMIKQNTLR